ncbi:MAG TPA: DNA adenine methylase [Verrucomicrobiae bacterium]|jgi:DNA adenine methylase|nr:DNA adenine methylase [Verrucomicrobiae bacterium]
MKQYRTPLRYPGGKQKIAPFIAELLSENDLEGGHYAETFAGGAGIAFELLFSGKVSHIHLNDSWYPIHAFWRSVVYKTEEFCRRISSVSLTVEEWRRQKEILSRPWEFDQIDVGFSVFYLNRCNRSGIIHGGGLIGGIDQSGKWKMDARYNRAKLSQRIEAIGQKHGSITLKNWDAERFIKEHLPTLPERALVYFDPPYFHKADGLYYNHYSPEDHKRIAEFIQQNVKQSWVVSYDGVKQILNYYSNRRHFRYKLQYNARKVYKGTEALFFSDQLKMPKGSIVPCIGKALKCYEAFRIHH